MAEKSFSDKLGAVTECMMDTTRRMDAIEKARGDADVDDHPKKDEIIKLYRKLYSRPGMSTQEMRSEIERKFGREALKFATTEYL